MTRPQKLLSFKEAAKRLGESLETIRTWIDVGLIQVHKTPSGKRSVPLELVERLLEKTKGEE